MIKPLGKIKTNQLFISAVERPQERKPDAYSRFERFLPISNNYHNNDATVCWWMDT